MIAAGEDPWGINGPDFLLYYGIALAVVFLIGLLLPRLVAGTPDPMPGRSPSAPVLALLTGGRARVVYASLAALRSAGAVAAGPGGVLVVAGPRPSGLSRVDYAVYDAAERRVRTRVVVQDPQVAAELDALEAEALRAGWYVPDGRRRLVRLGALLFLLLGGVGIVRIVVGSAAGFPVGYLIVLTVVGILFGLLLLAAPRVSPTGRKELQRARSKHSFLAPSYGPSWSTYGSNDAAMGVALFGSASLIAADPGFASDAGIPSDSGFGSGGSSGGDSGGGDSGGGSSCGGGGGCGGGSS
ncbi:TIGR04222 domain-containing membrane protein [Phytohabitans flavus]|uniref:TIGR04222 domain-containing membrane protein n=1 Tax=Phytohabitans flavus TaxID=1076124 RepID=A0A6F8XVK4_9ACTN|nr:TIGR04222 domain-containing membrane protein [Phytohabitans flavus]BCB77829.1 hypothetical protein Pflav_042390 [Phytohabitans flavus]